MRDINGKPGTRPYDYYGQVLELFNPKTLKAKFQENGIGRKSNLDYGIYEG